MEEILKHTETDLSFDSTELDNEALRIPQLHNKYLNFLHQEKMLLRGYEYEYRILKRLKWEYYTGKISEEDLKKHGWEPFQLKVLKPDIPTYLESDPDINKLTAKIQTQEEKCTFLENTIKGIMNRHWIIRSAIEWKKFTNGVS